MNEKIFIIGIGGTGMRCLESFVHLCAMGMLDNTEVDILALDTDRENGNFRRLKELVDVYTKSKGVNKEQYTLKETFFSAKINYHQFSPDYSRQDTGNFSRLVKYGDLRYSNSQQADLANLLFTKNTREFDLKHGYRAQTNLGSFLMYHNIIEEVQNSHDGDLAKFISSLVTACQTGKPKVFVLGSVFGGTGASSIPVLPKAFNKAANILAPGTSLKDAFFGAILLTSYFSFKVPSADYVARQLVVATSEKFAMNSQAAMMFYNEDRTVKHTYQKFYMLGTPTIDFSTDHDEKDTLTGGTKQENDSHYIELFAAFAAYDFFHAEEDELVKIRDSADGVQYYFRSVADDGTLEYSDFVKPDLVPKFAKRIGMATVMSQLVNLKADFYAAAKSGALAKNDNITGYEDIDDREVKAIKRYYELFNFSLDEGEVRNGWLRQIYKSAGGGDKFLLNAAIFSPTSEREFNKLNYSNKVYKEDFERHKFSTGLFGSPFDSFKRTFKERANDPSFTNKCEKLTKRMYDTLCTLYNFQEDE